MFRITNMKFPGHEGRESTSTACRTSPKARPATWAASLVTASRTAPTTSSLSHGRPPQGSIRQRQFDRFDCDRFDCDRFDNEQPGAVRRLPVARRSSRTPDECEILASAIGVDPPRFRTARGPLPPAAASGEQDVHPGHDVAVGHPCETLECIQRPDVGGGVDKESVPCDAGHDLLGRRLGRDRVTTESPDPSLHPGMLTVHPAMWTECTSGVFTARGLPTRHRYGVGPGRNAAPPRDPAARTCWRCRRRARAVRPALRPTRR